MDKALQFIFTLDKELESFTLKYFKDHEEVKKYARTIIEEEFDKYEITEEKIFEDPPHFMPGVEYYHVRFITESR